MSIDFLRSVTVESSPIFVPSLYHIHFFCLWLQCWWIMSCKQETLQLLCVWGGGGGGGGGVEYIAIYSGGLCIGSVYQLLHKDT